MATFVFDGSRNVTTGQFDLEEDVIVLDVLSTELASVDQVAGGVVFTAKNGTTFTLSGLVLADLATLQLNDQIVSSELSFDFGDDTGNELEADADGNESPDEGGLVVGALGDDTIVDTTEGEEDDLIFGNQGDDDITLNGGSDTIYGGQGDDIVTFDGLAENDAALVYGGLGDDSVDATGVEGMLTIYGGNGSVDAIDGNDTIRGGSEADVIYGNGGNDSIYGGTDDTIYGGQGDDTIIVDGDDDDNTDASTLIYGGVGSDSIEASASGDNITVYGGNGSADMADRADDISTGSGDDLIYGNGGDDSIDGGSGMDSIYGGQGDDSISGDLMSGSIVYGGIDEDTIEVTVSEQGDEATTIFGGNGAADATDGDDTITIGAVTETDAEDGDIIVYGNGGDDVIANNGLGDATVYGGQGDDTIYAGDETDSIVFGGQGSDIFVAGTYTPSTDGEADGTTEATMVMDFVQGTDSLEFGNDIESVSTVLIGDFEVNDIEDLSDRSELDGLEAGEVVAFRVEEGDLAGSTVVFDAENVIVLSNFSGQLEADDFSADIADIGPVGILPPPAETSDLTFG